MSDKIKFDTLKRLLSTRCALSTDEINGLEKEFFDFATTTTRPNNEVTYLLMEKAYKTLANEDNEKLNYEFRITTEISVSGALKFYKTVGRFPTTREISQIKVYGYNEIVVPIAAALFKKATDLANLPIQIPTKTNGKTEQTGD